MKKILLSMALLATAYTMQAGDYSYLNIETSSGSVYSLDASGISITFADGYLMAGTEKIAALADLSKMYFSNTKGTTGINSIESESADISIKDADAVYSINGQQIPAGTQLTKGIYIVKKNNRTYKMQVR